MIAQLSKKEKYTILFSILFVSIMFVSVYFFYLKPLKVVLANHELELASEEKRLNIIFEQKTLSSEKPYIAESTKKMQGQLPVQTLMDHFLLEIDRAETVSGSFVKSIEMGNVESSDEGQIDINTEEVPGKSEPLALAEGLEKTTMTMQVEAPDYFTWEMFVAALQSSERLTMINRIEFKDEVETESFEQGTSIQYDMTVSIFHMPELVDLEEELPKLHNSSPAKKRNPFYQLPDIYHHSN
ncbi:hypothetical protein [Cytobacillus purgationiresistens]|uniref:Type IV pilus assembly protein PilO n=1 Tax=Cytobacillus purgationiresistens TaxID=863449 RepID=A0ABU0AG31_9BACI|nr:hypothetical protein [Cytobacillus purgationiresistens]MDQ0269985.1 type IV pilus assembly protein PilO [Cytobacillus purgationiresistens]